MTTNTTPKKLAVKPESTGVGEAVEASPVQQPARTTVVGPALTAGATPLTVTLSHHLNIDGTDYAPGAEIRISPDYARRLRTQGYVSRT